MKKTFLVLMASALAFPAFRASAGNGLPDQPFVEVAGQSVLHVKPDYVEVNLTMSALAKDGATARRDVDAKLFAVAKILQELKVPEGAFESYQLNVMEERDYVGDKLTTLGYRATRQAKLTIRELDRAQEIMDALIEAPIELWENIEARVDNVGALREKAKIAAFEDAKQRAEVYARLANRKVGDVYRIGDQINGDFQVLESVTVTGSSIRDRGIPLFQVGDIEIKQQVRVIYLLD